MMQVFSLWRGTMLITRQYSPATTFLKADIAREVAEKYGLTVANLKGRSVVRFISRARHEAFWRCLEAGHSSSSVGRWFNRDHSTVLSGARAYQARLTKAEQRA